MSNIDNLRDDLTKKGMWLLSQKGVDPGSEEYDRRLKTYVDRNFKQITESPNFKMEEPYVGQEMATNLAEAPGNITKGTPLESWGDAASGALGALTDVTTRGVPDRVGQVLDALGIKTDIRKRTAGADIYAKSESADRNSRSPLSSAIGGITPDAAAALISMAGTKTAPVNEYRVLTGLEKVRKALSSMGVAAGAGGASEGLRYGEPMETPEQTLDRATTGALWGAGTDLGLRGAIGASNWGRNAVNKAPRDLAIDDWLSQTNPDAAAILANKGKRQIVDELNALTQGRYDSQAELPKLSLDHVQNSYGGVDYQIPPTTSENFKAFSRDNFRPATVGGPQGARAQPSTSILNSMNSVLGGGADNYANRVASIQELKMLANDPKQTVDAARRYADMAREMQTELDTVVASSGSNLLEGAHNVQKGAMSLYETEMSGLLPTSGTAVSKYIDEKMPEDILNNLILHPEMGQAASEYGRIIPGSKKYIDAMYVDKYLGKENLGNNTATENIFAPLGGRMDPSSEAMLERISRENYVSAIPRKILSKVGLSADKADLARMSDSVLKYGAKPAQQDKNVLASVLRGVVGSELGRYESSVEELARQLEEQNLLNQQRPQ